MSTIPLVLLALGAAASGSRGEVLDFSARWCGPCQQVAPLVARLEREGLPIRSVDVDAERELAQRFNVTAMPTFVLVIDGREVARQTGILSEDQLRAWLARIPQARPAEAVAQPGAMPQQPRGSSPFVADPRVQLGAAAPIGSAPEAALAAVAPAAGPGPAIESREPPQREMATAAADERRPGGWSLGGLLGSAGTDRRPEPQPVAIRASNAPLVDAAAQPLPVDAPMRASVRLRVITDGRINLGSGTIVESAQGKALIVTCGHVFRGFNESSKIEVNLFHLGQEQTLSGRLIKSDLESDVGLLEVDAPQSLPIVLVARDIQQALEQQSVIGIGCNGGQPPTREELIVTAVNPYLGPDNLECTGVPVQGRSGGGLFRTSGELVGICIAADPARKRGVYAGLKAIHNLLDQSGSAHLFRAPSAAPAGAAPPVGVADAATGAGPAAFPGASGAVPAGVAAASGSAAPGGSLFDSILPPGSIPTRESVEPPGAPAGGYPATAATSGTTSGPAPITLGPGAEDAEIVCIIRPRNRPEAASQVVIIHQASPKMLSYLRGELGTPVAGTGPAGAGLSAAPRYAAPRVAAPTPPAVLSSAATSTAEAAPLHQPYLRAAATFPGRATNLQATVLSTTPTPRRYVRTR